MQYIQEHQCRKTQKANTCLNVKTEINKHNPHCECIPANRGYLIEWQNIKDSIKKHTKLLTQNDWLNILEWDKHKWHDCPRSQSEVAARYSKRETSALRWTHNSVQFTQKFIITKMTVINTITDLSNVHTCLSCLSTFEHFGTIAQYTVLILTTRAVPHAITHKCPCNTIRNHTFEVEIALKTLTLFKMSSISAGIQKNVFSQSVNTNVCYVVA